MKSGEARILLGLRFRLGCLVDDRVPRLGVWARVRVQCGDAAWRLRRWRGVRPAVAGPQRAGAALTSGLGRPGGMGVAGPTPRVGRGPVAGCALLLVAHQAGRDDPGPIAAKVTSPPGSPAEQYSLPA